MTGSEADSVADPVCEQSETESTLGFLRRGSRDVGFAVLELRTSDARTAHLQHLAHKHLERCGIDSSYCGWRAS